MSTRSPNHRLPAVHSQQSTQMSLPAVHSKLSIPSHPLQPFTQLSTPIHPLSVVHPAIRFQASAVNPDVHKQTSTYTSQPFRSLPAVHFQSYTSSC